MLTQRWGALWWQLPALGLGQLITNSGSHTTTLELEEIGNFTKECSSKVVDQSDYSVSTNWGEPERALHKWYSCARNIQYNIIIYITRSVLALLAYSLAGCCMQDATIWRLSFSWICVYLNSPPLRMRTLAKLSGLLGRAWASPTWTIKLCTKYIFLVYVWYVRHNTVYTHVLIEWQYQFSSCVSYIV